MRSFYRTWDAEGCCLQALLCVVMNITLLIRRVGACSEEQVPMGLVEDKEEAAVFVLRLKK